jgi:hypothetical protein
MLLGESLLRMGSEESPQHLDEVVVLRPDALPWHLRARLRMSRPLTRLGRRLLGVGVNVLRVVEAPRLAVDGTRAAAYDALFREAIMAGGAIDYRLPHPKHEFLSYVVHHHGLLAHGSNSDDIEEFEARPTTEGIGVAPSAVHAASDGIWPIYFATVARGVGLLVLANGCFHSGRGERLRRYYYFAISRDPDDPSSWTDGTVYLLPRDTFRRRRIPDEEWVSDVPVRPIARLHVTPDDFPFRRSTVRTEWPEPAWSVRRRFERRHRQLSDSLVQLNLGAS